MWHGLFITHAAEGCREFRSSNSSWGKLHTWLLFIRAAMLVFGDFIGIAQYILCLRAYLLSLLSLPPNVSFSELSWQCLTLLIHSVLINCLSSNHKMLRLWLAMQAAVHQWQAFYKVTILLHTYTYIHLFNSFIQSEHIAHIQWHYLNTRTRKLINVYVCRSLCLLYSYDWKDNVGPLDLVWPVFASTRLYKVHNLLTSAALKMVLTKLVQLTNILLY